MSAMSLFKLGCAFIGGLFVLISVQFCRACWVLYIGLYGNAMRCPAVLFLSIIWVRHRGCFLFQERLGKCVRLGSSGAFADSLAVFAAPKRIGLRSHMRLSEVLVKSCLITSSDSFNLFSAGLKEPEGPDLRWDTV